MSYNEKKNYLLSKVFHAVQSIIGAIKHCKREYGNLGNMGNLGNRLTGYYLQLPFMPNMLYYNVFRFEFTAGEVLAGYFGASGMSIPGMLLGSLGLASPGITIPGIDDTLAPPEGFIMLGLPSN